MEQDQDPQGPTVIPVVEEELVVGTRSLKKGSVRVRKEVEHARKTIETPVLRDVTSVTRVPVNRPVSSMPEMREEGDTLVIPVVEEELVVRKRLILREEIRIQRRRVQGQVSKPVTLTREHAVIERLDADGKVIGYSDAAPRPPEATRARRHKSILE